MTSNEKNIFQRVGQVEEYESSAYRCLKYWNYLCQCGQRLRMPAGSIDFSCPKCKTEYQVDGWGRVYGGHMTPSASPDIDTNISSPYTPKEIGFWGRLSNLIKIASYIIGVLVLIGVVISFFNKDNSSINDLLYKQNLFLGLAISVFFICGSKLNDDIWKDDSVSGFFSFLRWLCTGWFSGNSIVIAGYLFAYDKFGLSDPEMLLKSIFWSIWAVTPYIIFRIINYLFFGGDKKLN